MDKQSPNNQTYNEVLYYNLNKYGDAKDILMKHALFEVYHHHTRLLKVIIT
jgi:hypothetical protein